MDQSSLEMLTAHDLIALAQGLHGWEEIINVMMKSRSQANEKLCRSKWSKCVEVRRSASKISGHFSASGKHKPEPP
jgi:hypothetical protein